MKNNKYTLPKTLACCLLLFLTVTSYGQSFMPNLEVNTGLVKVLSCSVNRFCGGTASSGCTQDEVYKILVLEDDIQLFDSTFSDSAIQKKLRFKKGTIIQISLHSYSPYYGTVIKVDNLEETIYTIPNIVCTEELVQISFNDLMPTFSYRYQGKVYGIEILPCAERITNAP